MTIEELKQIQKDNGLTNEHLIWCDEVSFVIAHTDAERESGMDLHTCKLHQTFLNIEEDFELS